MTPQRYHGFTKPVWKQQIIASRQKRILRQRKKNRRENMKSGIYLFCPRGSWEPGSLWCSGEEDFRGKPPEQSSWGWCWELLGRSGLTHRLATLFPPLASSYLLITFGFYSLTFKYAEHVHQFHFSFLLKLNHQWKGSLARRPDPDRHLHRLEKYAAIMSLFYLLNSLLPTSVVILFWKLI